MGFENVAPKVTVNIVEIGSSYFSPMLYLDENINNVDCKAYLERCMGPGPYYTISRWAGSCQFKLGLGRGHELQYCSAFEHG